MVSNKLLLLLIFVLAQNSAIFRSHSFLTIRVERNVEGEGEREEDRK